MGALDMWRTTFPALSITSRVMVPWLNAEGVVDDGAVRGVQRVWHFRREGGVAD